MNLSWLTVFGLVMKVALAVADILRDRKLIDAGEAIAIRKSLEETNARVDKALSARRAAAATGMRDDDPYLRD
jgi:hypothetical protein